MYIFEDLTIVAEIKTKKAYPIKLARRQLIPELHEVQQAGMYAMGVGADAIHLIYYAKDKATRITAIAGQVEDGMIPERFIPGHGTVPVLPEPGTMDAPWRCRYCDYWGLCDTLPAGQVAAADVLIPIRKEEIDV